MKICLAVLLISMSMYHVVTDRQNYYKGIIENHDVNQYSYLSEINDMNTHYIIRTSKRRICFFKNWVNTGARKRTHVELDWVKVDPFLCTHINYCFMSVGSEEDGWKMINRTKKVNSDKDIENLKKLKFQNPELKIIISLGEQLLFSFFEVEVPPFQSCLTLL